MKKKNVIHMIYLICMMASKTISLIDKPELAQNRRIWDKVIDEGEEEKHA